MIRSNSCNTDADAEEEIVISGVAGRFPNSDNLKEFQENLLNKRDLGTSDHGRWSNSYNMPHRIGKVNNIEKFDRKFFNISAIKAHVMDPMARMLFEHTYEAIIDAGINPKDLQGTRTSVITAISASETRTYFLYNPQLAGQSMTGTNISLMANRISYWLGITGPSYNIDTACSSSSFAMVKAYELIRSGDCDAAIIASANLCFHPYVQFQFYHLGVLSSDGYCKPYDEEGTGYMRSDTVAVIYLQKAKDARRIYASFVHGKINCDGFKGEGITFPSLEMQTRLLKEFYKECEISPNELSYMEAHTTGTLAGDPVEVMAIDQALCSQRNMPLMIGSVKSNLGHSEPASGTCQIAKVLLAMETGIITPTIHFKHPRKQLTAIIEGRIKIVTEPTEWKGGYICVNSFGFGGANSHILLKSNPKLKINNGTPNDDLPRLVAVSGRTEEAVKIILDDVQNRSIDAEYISLLHHIHNDNIEGHVYRGYMITQFKISCNTISKIEHSLHVKRPICFIFSGLGSQWIGMGRAVMKFPVFVKAIQRCDSVLRPYGILLTDILTSVNKKNFNNIINLILGLVGLQIGIVDLLTSIGIVPDFIIGHSIGELVCGYVDGCLTAEETILSAYFIGLALHESKIIYGSMAEINLDLETIKNVCPIDIDIACHNSSSNFIVSGPTSSIKAFLAKLQANNISVKEIFCGYIPFHSRYIKPAALKCKEYLNRILPQKKFRSSKWLSTSAYECANTSPFLCSKYYINYLLSSVIFTKMIHSIPTHAVTIEISSYSILKHIMKESLDSTVTNITLYENSEDHNGEIFLDTIGKLYNAGLQPQIANLYPAVEFPVSRGTPMISSLVRWDHSEKMFVMRHREGKVIDKREIDITIDTKDEEFVYLKGHVVNEKNLFPAMGYLFHVWEMIASLEKQAYDNTPIVFEDVNFIRATVLSQNDVVLTLSIKKGSNRFEITEGGNTVVTGTVRFPNNIENEKISANLADCVENEEEMSVKDIYKELRLRGYQYNGIFRGLKSASITGTNGHIAWKSNWVAFMDNMLQMTILGQTSRSLLVPTRIRKLTIDPKYHIQLIQNYPVEEREFLVYYHKPLDAIISGGIEICGIVATPIFRRQKAVNTILEEYKFVAHRDLENMSLQDAMRMSVHIALECCHMVNVKIIEFVEDSDKVTLNDLNAPFVSEILNDLPQIRHHTRIVTSRERFPNISLPNNVSTTEINKLLKDESCLMTIGFDILTKNNKKLYEQLLPLLMQQGFLLTLEESCILNDYSCLKTYELDVILEKQIKEKKLVLLRRMQNVSKKRYHIVHVHNYNFSWVDELKSIMKIQNETNANNTCTERIILVAEDFECGLLGLINCLRKEPGGEMIRSVFIQDNKAPAFSLQETLYTKQLQLDLPINVLRSGNIWGSYRHFPLPTLEPKLVEIASVKQTVEGDLSTLRWVENRMPSYIKREDLFNVIYSSLNFRDIMLATGRLQPSLYCNLNDLLGFEFAGTDIKGRRVMGICSRGGITNICAADKYLTWVVPNKWTMEDAATVPCVYTTCYVALYMKGKMKKSDKILIHSGTGGIGQAAIHLALYEGCEVFTTVGTAEKRQFIRKTFPSIPEENIGNSRDTSFEQMIMQRTGGRGVDIVLNSLAEEKLQASVRCLANGGRFLEIGKFDMFSNNPLNSSIFSKGITFYGILLDKIYSIYTEEKIMLSERIAEGLENGAIKPLCTKVFEKDEIETAFRYMATGKHIGKVIIKIREENEPLGTPLLAYPRYYCSERKCYIVLGGLGGFGLELANWLILRGAKNLVLTSRNGIKTGYQLSRIKLWQSYGVNVQIFTVDDTLKHEDCENILKLAEEMAPVDAIFNLAVVLKDCIFQNQSPQTFEDSFKSKAWMTKKMDELSRKICLQLRHFVIFSSVSCGRGNTGQTNYGMANSVMERICERRMEEGLHGLAIQWGAIGDVGLVADMQEENKELVIGGTLQQRISSCLNTLEAFLLQDRPVVSSMIVAEKAKIGGSMNIYETVAHIMGLKNMNAVPQNVSLTEMGMDSMMAVEIKQTLEREFDVSLTAQDIRALSFTKLRQMTITAEGGRIHKTNENDASNWTGIEALIRKTKNSDFVPDILVELATKKEVDRENVFLLPGIEGCSSIYKSIASGIKSSATCLQHGVLNIPNDSDSVMKSAVHLLPHVLKKVNDQKKFLIVGYSYGSLIAIELVRLLEASHFSGRLILIDGAPDQMKFWADQYLICTSQKELLNLILSGLLEMYTTVNKEMFVLELNKCNTLEEKLQLFHTYFPKDLNILTPENQKLLCLTVYNHIIAIKNYNVSSLPRLKSPITLIKPTFPMVSFTEEDYGLHKVTNGKVQIHYVKGTHITMMENDKIILTINEE